MFIHLLASLLFSLTITTYALPIITIDPVATATQLVIQYSPPEPLLEDIPRQGVTLGPEVGDGLLLGVNSDINRNEIPVVELSSSTDDEHFAFDFSPSSISPYRSFVDILSNALHTLASTLHSTFNTIYNLQLNHVDPPPFKGAAELYDSLDVPLLEEEYGDDGIYPIIDETTLSKKGRKKEVRMREGWDTFEKIMNAFIHSSFSPPPPTSSTPGSVPNKDSAKKKTSPFHRGIKDAARQA